MTTQILLSSSDSGPGWFGGSKAGTSAHKVVDQDSICEGVHRNTVAWHVGPGGNGYYIGYEFSGYASWTAAQWREPTQLAMLQIAAGMLPNTVGNLGGWILNAQSLKPGSRMPPNQISGPDLQDLLAYLGTLK